MPVLYSRSQEDLLTSLQFNTDKLFIDGLEIGDILDAKIETKSVMQETIEWRMRASAQRAERRVQDFMRRTGLKIHEIELAYFQHSGECYPQWVGALQLAHERSIRLGTFQVVSD